MTGSTTVVTTRQEVEQVINRLVGSDGHQTFRWPPLDRAITVYRESGDASTLTQALGLLKGNYGPLTHCSHTFGKVPHWDVIEEAMAALS